MWTYKQSTGEWLHNGEFRGYGYSGIKAARNDPTREGEVNVGPIPRNRYRISTDPIPHTSLGLFVFRLEPLTPDKYKRHGFLIHGDTASHDASHGCIILGHNLRVELSLSIDRDLEVI